jgi:hypothetical protein
MVGFTDPDTVDGRGQIGTRVPFQQFAKFACKHVTSAAQNPRRPLGGERIVQGFESYVQTSLAGGRPSAQPGGKPGLEDAYSIDRIRLLTPRVFAIDKDISDVYVKTPVERTSIKSKLSEFYAPG